MTLQDAVKTPVSVFRRISVLYLPFLVSFRFIIRILVIGLFLLLSFLQKTNVPVYYNNCTAIYSFAYEKNLFQLHNYHHSLRPSEFTRASLTDSK